MTLSECLGNRAAAAGRYHHRRRARAVHGEPPR